MNEQGRTFRVFVSSTFSDLKAERNAIHNNVFPRLRERCIQHGYQFQLLDLRWGISEKAKSYHLTMPICLEEIKRCRRISPDLFFLILIGNRYGWRPAPTRIPAYLFEEICKVLKEEDLNLLMNWYLRDDNAIPAAYRLRPRLGQFRNSSVWTPTERQINGIFKRAIRKLGLPKEERKFYDASATEQEIAQGALSIPDANKNVFCFFRNITNLPHDVTAHEFIDLDEAGHPDLEAQIKLKMLKHQLRQHLPANVLEYDAKWEDGKVCNQHLTQLCQDVYSRLAEVLDSAFNRYDKVNPLTQEILAHKTYCKEHANNFIGRKPLLQKIAEYLTHSWNSPFFVYGPPGSGKSALLAFATIVAQNKYPKSLIIARFAGITTVSATTHHFLRSIREEVQRNYQQNPPLDSPDPRDYSEELFACLKLATAEQPLILFLDGIDKLVSLKESNNLVWLPKQLPQHVRIIVSTTTLSPSFSKMLIGVLNSHLLEIPSMDTKEAAPILNSWLAKADRKLTSAQTDMILDCFTRCPWPRYLWLAFEEARLWDSSAKPVLGANIEEGIIRMLDRLASESNHGKTIIDHALGYLASTRAGLTEEELLDILSNDPMVLKDFRRRSPKSPQVNRLPDIVWSRLRFDLGSFICERNVGNDFLLNFQNSQFKEVVIRLFCKNTNGIKKHIAIATFFEGHVVKHSPDNLISIRRITEMPWHWYKAKQWDQLARLLANPEFFTTLYSIAPNDTFVLWHKLETSSHYTAITTYQPILKKPQQYSKYLASLCEYFKFSGQIEQALTLAEAEFNCACTVNNASRLCKSQRTLGILLQSMGRSKEAIRLFCEQEKSSRKSGDLDALHDSLGNQANLLNYLGQTDKALTLISEQKKIAPLLGDSSRIFSAYYNEAVTRVHRGELEEAVALITKCEKIARAKVSSSHLVIALCMKADLLAVKNEWATALRVNTEALNVCRSRDWPINQRPVLDTFYNRVKILRKLRLFNDAILLLLEQEKKSSALSFYEGVRSSLSQQALIAKDMGDYTTALDLHLQSEDLCRKMKLSVQLAKELVNQAILLLTYLEDPVMALQKAAEAQTIFEWTEQEYQLDNVKKLIQAINKRLLDSNRSKNNS